jgi:hypothetical protein
MRQRVAGFKEFGSALQRPNNAAVFRSFVLFSAALCVLPLLTYMLCYRVVLVAVIPDGFAVMGFDRSTWSGFVAVSAALLVQAAYVVYAFVTDDGKFPTETEKKK